jgi:putative ABC transport system substrate-binding protein
MWSLRASESIPIVMLAVADPVRSGPIASYARPGGNVTGTSRSTGTSLGVKLLDLLRQLVPGLARVAVVFEPVHLASKDDIRDIAAAAQLTGIDVQAIGITSPEDLEPALNACLAGQPQALISNGGVIVTPHFSAIAGFALQHRLPTTSYSIGSLAAGGLLFYGPQLVPLFRRAGSYHVDRILRGAKPADLPVEGPTVFDLVINRTTAAALGLTIPPDVATQVTEWVW